MAVKKINYNNKIATCMHRPVTGTNKYVLYPKVKDFTGEIEGSTLAEKDPEYIKMSQIWGNSPTNIRQVFITGRRVYTYLYSSIQSNNKVNNQGSFEKTYEGDDNDMFEIAHKFLEYERFKRNPSMAAMSKITGDKEPNQYIVEGNILGAIANPYTCNNIEEIYLDWTIFLSRDPYIKQCFGDRYTSCSAIESFLNGNYNSEEIDMTKNIINLFASACMGNTKNLRKRFPKLKFIAIVSKLDDLIKDSSNIKPVHLLKSELNAQYKDRVDKTWYELNRSRISASGSLCLTCKISGASKSAFVIKDNHYRFDREVLKIEVNTMLQKLKEIERREKYGVNNEENINENDKNIQQDLSTLCKNERYLIELEQKYGLEYVKNVLVITVSSSKQSELNEFFADFTPPNRKKYLSLLGL